MESTNRRTFLKRAVAAVGVAAGAVLAPRDLLAQAPSSSGRNEAVADLDVTGTLHARQVNHKTIDDTDSPYTVLLTDKIIGVDTTSGAVTITVPSDFILLAGWAILIKDEGGNANANNITIATEGGETIDGEASLTISTDDGSEGVYSNGTNLYRV